MSTLKDKYDSIEIPEKLNENIVAAMNNAREPGRGRKRFGAKRVIVAVALITVCLTMLVSAGTILYNTFGGVYIIPGKGVMQGINENVRSIAAIQPFGELTVEMAVAYEEDGVRKLGFALSDYNKKPTLERGMYENLRLVFPDGSEMTTTTDFVACGYSETDTEAYYGHSESTYTVDNFPDFDSFTLYNDAFGFEAEINLLPIGEDSKISVIDNGVKRIKVLPAAKGSNYYSYTVETIVPSELEKQIIDPDGMVKFINYSIYQHFDSVNDFIEYNDGESRPNMSSMTNDGRPIFVPESDYSYHTWGEFTMQEPPNRSGVKRIMIDKIGVDVAFKSIDDDGRATWLDIPLPADGETIEFDSPYSVGVVGEFDLRIRSVKRAGGIITITALPGDVVYSGNEDLSDIIFYTKDSSTGGGAGGMYTSEIPVNVTEGAETAAVELISICYLVSGNWEIDFN